MLRSFAAPHPLMLALKGKEKIMDFDESEIQDAIVKSLKDIDIPFKVSDEIAFHMTDWLSGLSQWEQFCKNPKSLSSDELSDLLMGFLAHVPAHVAAASKLLSGSPVTDVFNVGAVSES